MKGRSFAALLGLIVGDSAAAADFLVEVRVDVQRGCALVNQPRTAGAQALGLLDFGQPARLDAADGPLSTALLSQRPPRLECNPDTAYQLKVDGGEHGGLGEVRFMASEQARVRPIPYRLYQDPAWRVPLPVDTVLHGRVPDSGSVELPLFARIDRLTQVPHAGRYSDLLKVTVSW
ncbi:spore coat U domain-containing protein [Pseudomonas sp. SDI]|uniref:Csu type fimbrial protein n=1 Tax=Pseudomonas sp. SDI TaxID=2170734 RepID=UPI0026B24ECF